MTFQINLSLKGSLMMFFPELMDDFSSNKTTTSTAAKKKPSPEKNTPRRFLTKELLEISFGLIQKISNHGQPEALNSDPDRMKECPRKPVGKIIQSFLHVVEVHMCRHDVSI